MSDRFMQHVNDFKNFLFLLISGGNILYKNKF